MNNRCLFKAKQMYLGELPKEQWWVQGYIVKHSDVYWIYTGEIDKTSQYSNGYGTAIYQPIKYQIEPATICQCTVLKKESTGEILVWENDIYQWENPVYGKCTGIVRFGEYLQDGSGGEYPAIPCYGFYVAVKKVEPHPESCLDAEDYPYYQKQISILKMFKENLNIKPIGNIFDNPELLEN